MIAFIEGLIEEKNPAYIILNCGGIGYLIHISLYTYSAIPDKGNIRIHTIQVIREDAHTLYGFSSTKERDLFRHLITVSGVGPNTARMILSSISPAEIRSAIITKNISMLQSTKGIGAKTAQRIVVDLKDRLEKDSVPGEDYLMPANNTIHEEALSALVMLGFNKSLAQKAIGAILRKKQGEVITAEELVKEALKSV
jgi:holliday junction DNA helicase RuvA